MKKILFISHSSEIAGAELCLFDLLANIDKNRYKPLVLLPARGPLADMLEEKQIDIIVFRIPWWLTNDISFRHIKFFIRDLGQRVKMLTDIIKQHKIDIVYSNTLANLDSALAAKKANKPHIWHIHELLNKHNNLKSCIPIVCYKHIINYLSDRIIVPSNCAKFFYHVVYNNKIKVVNNGIKLDTVIIDGKNDLKKQYNLPGNAKLIGIIGSLMETKGQADFIKAAKAVSDKLSNCYFIIIGTGKDEYINKLECLVEELQLQDKIFFTGHCKDIASMLNQIDILVSASYVECFPRVIIEAMLAGKPVVATNSGGPAEMIIHGSNGFLVDVGNPKQMADALVRIMSDEQCKEMGHRAKLFAQSKYDLENYVRSIEMTIDEVLL